MLIFKNQIVIIGYGSVSRCFLPILLRHIDIPLAKITIIDFQEKTYELSAYPGINYGKIRITEHNLNKILSEILHPGDLLIDLGYSIGLNDILRWCHDHKVLYLNTSTEVWDTVDLNYCPIHKKTLYDRHFNLDAMIKNWDKKSTTAVIEHGANPGLVSSFVKKGLIDIAHRALKEEDNNGLIDLVSGNRFPELARALGVNVIHCSERDTQITDNPKEVGEFVGTWSIEGFREEGTACVELGWGTHEPCIPKYACFPDYGPRNQIFLAKMGMNTLVRSWVPYQEIVGMVVRHGEGYTLSKYLTVVEDDKVVYRPTVHYAYLPCDSTIASIQELRCNNYQEPYKSRILSNDIIRGSDILGALLMGHDYNSWWTGSALNIDLARRLVPGQNATTVQVAIGVMAAVLWMIENPEKGVCVPEDLPHDYILKRAEPYLGDFLSVQSDWAPYSSYSRFFSENPDSGFESNMWSFENFLLKE